MKWNMFLLKTYKKIYIEYMCELVLLEN